MTIEASGQGGQMAFDGHTVTITRNGVLGRMQFGRGDKRIPLHAISSVQWKPTGMITNGFIQLSLAGADKQSLKGRRTHQASQDENSVLFTPKQQPAFEALRAALEAALAAQHQPGPPVQATGSVADELGKLAALLQQGLISQQEFAAQKARLLQ